MCALLYYLCLKFFLPVSSSPSVGNSLVLQFSIISEHAVFPENLSDRKSPLQAPSLWLIGLRGPQAV